MAEQKENPTKCERCGSEKPPINEMNPNTSGYPTKRVDLCAVCVAKDPEATFVSGPGLGAPVTPESVPDMVPVVPDDPNVVETKEFAPKLQELNVEPQTPAGKLTGKDPEPPKDLGPVPPDVIREKIAAHEANLDKVIEIRRKIVIEREQLNSRFNQVVAQINIEKVAIATLRGLLGDAS